MGQQGEQADRQSDNNNPYGLGGLRLRGVGGLDENVNDVQEQAEAKSPQIASDIPQKYEILKRRFRLLRNEFRSKGMNGVLRRLIHGISIRLRNLIAGIYGLVNFRMKAQPPN